MKKFFVGLLVFGSTTVFASSVFCDLGAGQKKKVSNLDDFLVCVDAESGKGPCYDQAKPLKATKELKKMAEAEYELTTVFSRYDKKDKVIIFSYVDMKCVDDDYRNTSADCQSEFVVPFCSVE